MYGVHVNFDGGNWVRARGQTDDVTSLQVEHPACVHGTAVIHCSLYWRLRQGNDIVVHKNMSSSIVFVVNFRVGQGFWVYGIQGLFKSGIRYISAEIWVFGISRFLNFRYKVYLPFLSL